MQVNLWAVGIVRVFRQADKGATAFWNRVVAFRGVQAEKLISAKSAAVCLWQLIRVVMPITSANNFMSRLRFILIGAASEVFQRVVVRGIERKSAV